MRSDSSLDKPGNQSFISYLLGSLQSESTKAVRVYGPSPPKNNPQSDVSLRYATTLIAVFQWFSVGRFNTLKDQRVQIRYPDWYKPWGAPDSQSFVCKALLSKLVCLVFSRWLLSCIGIYNMTWWTYCWKYETTSWMSVLWESFFFRTMIDIHPQEVWWTPNSPHS